MNLTERIYKQLSQEVSGEWYISNEFGETIIIKVPSTLLKSIIGGCRVRFLYGKNSRNVFPIFHTAIRVYDDPIHFATISNVLLFKNEHLALQKIMNLKCVDVHFYNELNVCVATAEIHFDKDETRKVLDLIGNIEELYTGSFNQVATNSLNCFDYTLDKTRTRRDVYEIDVSTLDFAFSNWKIINNLFWGINESNPIIFNDANEGEVLEKQVWIALENLFGKNLYRNPQIKNKYSFRELTDVLAFHKCGIFLFETKALGLLDLEKERNMDRKVKGIQNQVEKGIEQLKGAAKKVAANTEIFNLNGTEISFDKSIKPHCIVLVSELLPFGDWKEIVHKMFTVMIEQPLFLHVMDLTEFMTYAGVSRGSKERLDLALMDRIEELINHKSIHIKLSRDNTTSGNNMY